MGGGTGRVLGDKVEVMLIVSMTFRVWYISTFRPTHLILNSTSTPKTYTAEEVGKEIIMRNP